MSLLTPLPAVHRLSRAAGPADTLAAARPRTLGCTLSHLSCRAPSDRWSLCRLLRRFLLSSLTRLGPRVAPRLIVLRPACSPLGTPAGYVLFLSCVVLCICVIVSAPAVSLSASLSWLPGLSAALTPTLYALPPESPCTALGAPFPLLNLSLPAVLWCPSSLASGGCTSRALVPPAVPLSSSTSWTLLLGCWGSLFAAYGGRLVLALPYGSSSEPGVLPVPVSLACCTLLAPDLGPLRACSVVAPSWGMASCACTDCAPCRHCLRPPSPSAYFARPGRLLCSRPWVPVVSPLSLASSGRWSPCWRLRCSHLSSLTGPWLRVAPRPVALRLACSLPAPSHGTFNSCQVCPTSSVLSRCTGG